MPDEVMGDPGRLRQVFLNLLGNAVKFTDRGQISICAAVDSLCEKRCTVLFSISDTGIGVPEEKQNSIFAPFAQADMSITRKHGGTGLGLPISQHLISLMGGKMWLESEEGKGSSFHFTVCFNLTGVDVC